MLRGKLKKVLGLLTSMALVAVFMVQATLCFVTVQSETMVNTFVPVEKYINNLVISKFVEHPLGEGYQIPKDVAFNFDVNLGDRYKNAVVKTTVGNYKADENGVITLNVKPNTPVSVIGLEMGTDVKVTEKQGVKGFTVKGEATQNITISDGQVSKVDFVNIYSPESVKDGALFVSGKVSLEGREWYASDKFTVNFERQVDGKWVKVGSKTIKSDSYVEPFNFVDDLKKLTFDKVGEYKFRLYQEDGSSEGIKYDNTVLEFTVGVTDTDMDGSLEISKVDCESSTNVTWNSDKGRYEVYALFNNTYKEVVDKVEIPIKVTKKLTFTGDKTIGLEGFSFVLKNNNTGEIITRESSKEGIALFNLKYSNEHVGKTFMYDLYELDEGVEGVTYDTKTHMIGIAIDKDSEGNVYAVIVLDGETVESCEVEFHNKYQGIVEDEDGDNTNDDINGDDGKEDNTGDNDNNNDNDNKDDNTGDDGGKDNVDDNDDNSGIRDEDDDSPSTGDNSRVLPWLVLGILSFIGLLIMLFKKETN